jgi:hypothetical protein
VASYKPKKKRKLTQEQKAAAAERLAKARANRAPSELKSVHPVVRDLPEDHDLSYKNVKAWIKTTQAKIATAKSEVKAGNKEANAKKIKLETYLSNLQSYIRTGVWVDLFWGEHMEHKMGWKCVAPAYDHNHLMKMNPNTAYDSKNYIVDTK